MKRNFSSIAWAALGLAFWAGSSESAPSSRVAWTPETLQLVKSGDPERGKRLAESCQACHGSQSGDSVLPNPVLNAQLATYIFRQLHDYKDGARQHAVMSSIASGLSEQDMADLAQWYAHQKPVQPPAAAKLPETPTLVVHGDSKRLIPPCGICHGGGGQGEPVDTPRLAGQTAAYLNQTLAAYRSGERHNDIYRRMRAMSERLSEDEIRALAEYYSLMR